MAEKTKAPKPSKAETLTRLWQIAPMMVTGTPHGKALGLRFVSVDIAAGTIALPYNVKFIGDKKTRVMAGGAVTALLDQTCGLAAMSAFETLSSVATLDLRIDYMRAASPGEDIIAEARCYKATRNVAFIRAIAHDGDPDDPVASAQAIFMTTPSGNRDYMKPMKDSTEGKS